MRYTKIDISNTFGTLVRVADRAGIDSSAWSLQTGSSAYGQAYVIFDNLGGGKSTVARLSPSRAESVALMRAMADAFRLVAFTREGTLR